MAATVMIEGRQVGVILKTTLIRLGKGLPIYEDRESGRWFQLSEDRAHVRKIHIKTLKALVTRGWVEVRANTKKNRLEYVLTIAGQNAYYRAIGRT